MKLKSLFLGSAAAVGLSTGAFAADLATVVSSFDVCENLGISGTLQLASTDDCLQISGGVTYEFNWGDYKNDAWATANTIFRDDEGRTIIDNGSFPGTAAVMGVYAPAGGGATYAAMAPAAPGDVELKAPVAAAAANTDSNLDWRSRMNYWLQFVGSAKSDFGTAKAVIKFASDDEDFDVQNEQPAVADGNDVFIKEAYVSIGDTTKIIAGRRDASVFQDGDDKPFGFIGMFHSDEVDPGVDVFKDRLKTKGHVIQLYHTIGDSGLTLSAGLENLNGDAYKVYQGATAPALSTAQSAGTLVGTIAYASDNLTGHVSFAAGGILDAAVEDWKMHAGMTGVFDNFKVRGAFAGGSANNGAVTSFNGLVSAEATFDMFTLSAGLEAANRNAPTNLTQWGGNVTGSAAVTDQVTIAAGFRWFDSDTSTNNSETYQAALQIIAAMTESLKMTGEVGYYSVGSAVLAPANAGTAAPASVSADGAFYGSAELAWNPGGQFTSSVKGELNSLGGYKATFKASKTFD